VEEAFSQRIQEHGVQEAKEKTVRVAPFSEGVVSREKLKAWSNSRKSLGPKKKSDTRNWSKGVLFVAEDNWEIGEGERKTQRPQREMRNEIGRSHPYKERGGTIA